MVEFSSEEAYILGCLLGRGSIDIDKGGYKLVLRFPHVSYDPIGESVVRALEVGKGGLTYKELLGLPEVKTRGVMKLGLVLARLAQWHPPRVETRRSIISKRAGKWRIGDTGLTSEYLKWQKLYLQRENSWKDFVISQIKSAASFMASNIDSRVRIDQFGHTTMVIECGVPDLTVKYLKENYGLDTGDIYKHWGIPQVIMKEYSKELTEEFTRGLADTIATIDRYISRLYRAQFSVINENRTLPVDICALLQEKLQIPVYYIGWAGTEYKRKGKYGKRGGRDHLVKVWLTNFKDRFEMPLFHNHQKQVEFLERLNESEETAKKTGISRSLIGFCPSERRKIAAYMNICLRQGCLRMKTRPLNSWT